jgi:hypothetical protein
VYSKLTNKTRGIKMNSARKYDIMQSHAGKGLSNMKYKRSLSSFSESLVSLFATYDGDGYTLNFSDLPDEEQNELARLYIDSTGRDVVECVNGKDFSLDNDYISALLLMLKDNSRENREHFAEVTRKNIIIYYEQSLQELIDEACDTYMLNMNHENNYYSHIDQDHGDIYWSRY